MDKVIVKCLEQDPNRRYPFFSVLAHDLKQLLYV